MIGSNERGSVGQHDGASRTIVLPTSELVPPVWRAQAQAGPVRAFNPGLLADATGWLLAYRVVLADMHRRIAICRLSANLSIVPGSVVAWSDLVQFQSGRTYPESATSWFADPRLFRLGSRVFLYWNSGWHTEANTQFLHELDPATLRPIGRARELVLSGPRQHIEKNWTFFGQEPWYAVYSISPHRILSVQIEGDGDVVCRPLHAFAWDDSAYVTRYGSLRGGAPPQLVDGAYYSFCHSVVSDPLVGPASVADAPAYRYVPAVYRFSASPPFWPTHTPVAPVLLHNPFGTRTLFGRLNPVMREVLYPAGASYADGQWTISFGINDEHAAVAIIPHAELQRGLRPVAGDRALSWTP